MFLCLEIQRLYLVEGVLGACKKAVLKDSFFSSFI